MYELIPDDWQRVVAQELEQPYFQQLTAYVEQQYATATVYPAKQAIFTALHETPFEKVKVVILGQDPYHGEGQAHGLSFSVLPGVKHPPSLKNMLKELQDDIGGQLPQDGTLTKWAQQGVLLLNTVLTVRAGEANSHKGKGWEQFTDAIIAALAKREAPIVFILWGKPAQDKAKLIHQFGAHHAILQAPHPSPLSSYRGFLGSKPYSKTNALLEEWGQSPIQWQL